MSTFPTIKVEVGFNLDPGTYAPGVYFQIGSSKLEDAVHFLAPDTNWWDLSDRVRALSITRGRNVELDRVETGTCQVTFANRDRLLDPTNASSPLYPNVIPMRRIRVSATDSGITYPLFNGFVEGWPPTRRSSADAEVSVTAVDALAVLQAAQLINYYGFAWAGTRINDVLDDMGWPAGDRLIDDGASRMNDADFTTTSASALEHIQAVADSDGGVLFVKPILNGTGQVAFHDRHHRRESPLSLVSQATFGNTAADLAFVDMAPTYDVAHIYNDVRLTVPDDPQEAQAQDLPSQKTYWPRTLSRSTELYSWEDAHSQAAYLLARYKDPHLRFESLTIKPGPAGDLWPHVLGREISDRITVNYRAVDGVTIVQDAFIEGVSHAITPPFGWQTTFQLSTPLAMDTGGFTFGDATLGVIGTGTPTPPTGNALVY